MKIEARPWKHQDLIDDLQEMIDEEPDRYLNDRRTTLCMARDHLKKYFSTYFENKHLTLEQLRGMDGEPVWVQTPGIPQYGRWVIVAGVDTEYGQRTLYCQGDYTCRNYGRDWIAYRRKPEE